MARCNWTGNTGQSPTTSVSLVAPPLTESITELQLHGRHQHLLTSCIPWRRRRPLQCYLQHRHLRQCLHRSINQRRRAARSTKPHRKAPLLIRPSLLCGRRQNGSLQPPYRQGSQRYQLWCHVRQEDRRHQCSRRRPDLSRRQHRRAMAQAGRRTTTSATIFGGRG